MDCRILGRLEVVGPSGSVHPVAARQRMVLAMLLLEVNHVVSIDRLVDAVWDEDPPATARGQIQICVSALRRSLTKAGVGGAIVTEPAGYLFRAEKGELDLTEFDRLVASARAAAAENRLKEAAESFGQALSLWEGDALPGLRNRLLQSVAARMSERRLAVTEEYMEALLGLGMHHKLIGELMALTAEHPLREKLRCQLMTALYRDGRRAEALEVYQQARRSYIDQLGLEPGAALKDLEQAILAGEAKLLPSAVSPAGQASADSWWQPRMLPAEVTDFVGREKEAAQIGELLLRDRPSPNIALVTGRGGVGKTSLAVHMAHSLAGSFPDGQLYASLRGGEQHPSGPAEVLERFLRVLGVPGPAIPQGLDARSSFYRSRLASRQVLIVLDDAASEEQVLPLLPGHRTASVIVTSRVLLPRISASSVEVGLLPAIDGLALLEQVVGAERVCAEPAQSRALVQLCGGLPLALRIAAARLAARPHWSVGQLVSRLTDEHRRLDELVHHNVGIRASIAAAYDRLEEDAQLLFRRLAIADTPDFGRWLPIPLMEMDQDRAEDLLDQLVDVRLLDAERLDSGVVRYQFHNLIRVYAREKLASHEPEAKRKAALRRMLRAWLYLADHAHSRAYGGDYTILHSTVKGWKLPCKAVETELADPLAWYETERVALVDAIRQAANAGLTEICWDLAMSAVTLFETHSYLDDWRETHETALAACRRAGDKRGESVMLYSLGSLALCEGRFAQANDMLEQSLAMFEELGELHGIGLADRNLARIDRVRGNASQAIARYDRALTALRAVGDAVGQAHVLSKIAQIRTEQGQHDEADALLASSIEMASQAGCRRVEAQARNMLGRSLLNRSDLAGACRAFHAVVSATRLMGDLVGEAHALHGLGTAQLRLGDHAQAELLLGQAQRMANDTREGLLLAQVLLTRGELCLETGQAAEAARHLSEAKDRFDRLSAEPWSAVAVQLLTQCSAADQGLRLSRS